MNILDKIIAQKKIEVSRNREAVPMVALEKTDLFKRKPYSFKKFILEPEKSGIIAEYKRRSPSKGEINPNVTVEEVVKGYQSAGVSAVSVLTDKEFFGGENKDLLAARNILTVPILRKDFIIDEYQIAEARSIGADVILLIAANLSPERTLTLATFAKNLGMEVLMEVHNEEELLGHVNDQLDVIGVNNRNLKDFTESIETSMKLSELIPKNFVRISESGISKAETIMQLKEYGYEGFLIGETFMRYADPGEGCKKLIEQIKLAENTKRKA